MHKHCRSVEFHGVCFEPPNPVLIAHFNLEHVGANVWDEDRSLFVPHWLSTYACATQKSVRDKHPPSLSLARKPTSVIVGRCLERRLGGFFPPRVEVHSTVRVLDTDFLCFLEVARRQHREVENAIVTQRRRLSTHGLRAAHGHRAAHGRRPPAVHCGRGVSLRFFLLSRNVNPPALVSLLLRLSCSCWTEGTQD